jgi:hypothetical protein
MGGAVRPKRIQERFITISVVWPNDEWDRHQSTSERIREHIELSLGRDRPPKMVLVYDALGIPQYGYIESVPMGAKAHQVTYAMDLRMKLVNVNNSSPSKLRGRRVSVPYLPTANAPSSYGPDWYAPNDTYFTDYSVYEEAQNAADAVDQMSGSLAGGGTYGPNQTSGSQAGGGTYHSTSGN